MELPVLTALAAELRDEGSLLSDCVPDRPRGAEPFAELLAAGPRTAAQAAAYGAIIESVREGYLLHYGSPRIVVTGDEDLALLAGDYLYAKGLERLAALGDLPSVRELSDLISLSAQLHADGSQEDAAETCNALWLGSTIAIAVGPSGPHEQGKAALRGTGEAGELLRAAVAAAREAGLDEQLARAAETVGFATSHLG